MKKVITLVGMPGAGKSFCVDHLTAQGFPKVYFGGVVVGEVQNRGMEVNEANEKLVREELRATDGLGAIAKRIVPQIEQHFADGHDVVIADGLYSWTEYKIFKEKWGDNVLVIAISAPRLVRHARLAQRPVRPLTSEQATSRDYAEIENLEKGGPIANADYTLINDDTPDLLLANLDTILRNQGVTATATGN